MLAVGQVLYLPVIDSQHNALLVGARVLQVEGAGLAVEMPGDALPPVGGPIQAYFHAADGAFQRVGMRVELVDQTHRFPHVHLVMTDEPTSCDHRESPRIDVADLWLTVVVDGLVRCRVLDVSESGMAFDAPSAFAPDQEIALDLATDNATASGVGKVRSVRVYGPNYRCGVWLDEEQVELRALLDELIWRQVGRLKQTPVS